MQYLATTNHIFTVTELNVAARNILEDNFAAITVTGEISNLACPASGHMYFTLKDNRAQIRCALFRMQARKLNFIPEDGMQVQVTAKVSIYPDRGDYQLIVHGMQLNGEGALRIEFEKLVKKLELAGLFAKEHKLELPFMPQHIGIITSPTGAAVRDILTILKRRCPIVPITIYPTAVQGTNAPQEIIHALQLAQQHQQCDVLIIGRGGGSLEDLWAFNNEQLAQAIFDCKLPIISAVGHEVDITISDLVADIRAPTPSAAAELIAPEQATLMAKIQELTTYLINNMQQKFQNAAQKLDWLSKRLRNPTQQLQEYNLRLQALTRQLHNNIDKNLVYAKQLLNYNMRALDTISPLATLTRGYSIVTNTQNNKIITDAGEIKPQDELHIKLAKGSINCKVAVSSN